MFSDAMVNVGWATPQAIGRLTIPQFMALCSDRPPTERRVTAEEAMRIQAELDS